MKVAFNGIGCGWGNNGGTQSVFRMADALNELGVETELWAHCPSRFTWFKPKTKVRVGSLEEAPAVDVLINSGCATTMPTYTYPRKKIGVQWLRAHEVWAKPKNELWKLYGLDMPLWANSAWMTELIKNAGIRSDTEVQFCGVPHQEFYPVAIDKDATCLHIGALWSSRGSKGPKDIMKLDEMIPGKVKWHLYGNEKQPSLPGNMTYIQQPSMEAKRELYSKCDIWFAPSELEGLHIPPMEAALCGAIVVANEIPSAGNMDYCVHGVTGLLYGDLSDAAGCINREMTKTLSVLNERMVEKIKNEIGDVKINAERMIDRLERLI